MSDHPQSTASAMLERRFGSYWEPSWRFPRRESVPSRFRAAANAPALGRTTRRRVFMGKCSRWDRPGDARQAGHLRRNSAAVPATTDEQGEVGRKAVVLGATDPFSSGRAGSSWSGRHGVDANVPYT